MSPERSSVPKVLYFWRTWESVAGDIDPKLFAADAVIRAVSEHLERLGITAEFESSEWFPFIYLIKYELSEEPLVSVIIVNEGNYDELKECIDSIFEKSTYSKYEIVIINLGPPNEKINAYFDELKRNINVRKPAQQDSTIQPYIIMGLVTLKENTYYFTPRY